MSQGRHELCKRGGHPVPRTSLRVSMNYLALASDYDGTLARDGHVDDEVVGALRRFRESGRKLILVTGRELPELLSLFSDIALCDLVVGENGGLLYWPGNQREEVLAEAP